MFFRLLLACGLTIASFSALAQTVDYSDEIDSQVWAPFSEGYETHNTDLYFSILTDDFVSVSVPGGTIDHGSHWRSNTIQRFARVKETGMSGKFTFRFNHRIHSSDVAYEKGVYRLDISRADGTTAVNYGAFDVVLVKENERWKIRLDANSVATEADYLAANGTK